MRNVRVTRVQNSEMPLVWNDPQMDVETQRKQIKTHIPRSATERRKNRMNFAAFAYLIRHYMYGLDAHCSRSVLCIWHKLVWNTTNVIKDRAVAMGFEESNEAKTRHQTPTWNARTVFAIELSSALHCHLSSQPHRPQVLQGSKRGFIIFFSKASSSL